MKMGPNKLEKNFRDKLEQRTINPGPMAWDRLDAMLSVAEKKKRPGRTWLYMAASFLVFATLGAFFLNQEDSNNTIINEDSIVTKEQPARAKETTTPEQTSPVPAGPDESGVAAIQQERSPIIQFGAKGSNKGSKAIEDAKKEHVANVQDNASQIASHQPSEYNLPANEAENLMAAADVPETPKKRSVTVDPNSLLSSVEGELDQNFREKAYSKVVKNFNVVKTAVVNRNYQ
jgi:hypothetical protein